MSEPFFILAQLEGLNSLNPTAPISKSSGMVFKDVLVIVMTGLTVGLFLVLCAKIFLRRAKERRQRHRTSVVPQVSNENAEGEHARGRRRHRRRRRLRREHRLRNPTLAETGGLPPPKTEEPSNPAL